MPNLMMPVVALGALAFASLVACGDDSLPLSPEAPGAAEAVLSPTTSAVANTWATSAPMPTKRFGLVAATVNGIIYAIGGQGVYGADPEEQPGVKLAKVEAFNPGTGKWVTKAPLPARRAWPSGAAVINGKIYVPGGLSANGTPTKTLYVYNPSTNTWSTKAPLPVVSAGGAVAAINGKLYVLTPTANTSLLHRYDPANNTWTTRASVPRAHHYPASGVIDGKLYIAGTMNTDKSPLQSTSVYDPATNTWAERDNMAGAQVGAGSRVIGKKLYVVGGSPVGPFFGHTGVTVYNPATDDWTGLQSMPTARGFLAAATANGLLYALGGVSFPNVLATNERYTP